MCLNLRITCSCGKRCANIMNRGNILPREVVRNLWCPDCAGEAVYEQERMIEDNGWIVEFRMDLARNILAGKFGDDRHDLDPAFLFDNGYSSWNGFTPTDLEDSLKERDAIRRQYNKDILQFMARIKEWGLARVRTLSDQGWRKAKLAM